MNDIDRQIQELQQQKQLLIKKELEEQKEKLKIWGEEQIGKTFRTKFYGNVHTGCFEIGKVLSYSITLAGDKYYVELKGEILRICLDYLLIDQTYKGGGSRIMATIEKLKKNKTTEISSIETYSFIPSHSIFRPYFSKHFTPDNIPNGLIPIPEQEYNDAKEFAEYIDHLILNKFKYVLDKNYYIFPDEAIKKESINIDIPHIKITSREEYLLGDSIKSFLNRYNEFFLTESSMQILKDAVSRAKGKYYLTFSLLGQYGERYRSSENEEVDDVLNRANVAFKK